MKYATLPSTITSAIAMITLNFRDPMKEALLLAISCSSRVSKVNVGWSGEGEGFKSGLLRGCGCSVLAAGTRMGSRVDGGFAPGAGPFVAGAFAPGVWACATPAGSAGLTGGAFFGDCAATSGCCRGAGGHVGRGDASLH